MTGSERVMQINEMVDAMKDIPLFKDIANDNTKMESLASIMEFRKYKKGDYIFKEQEKGDELFILTSGSVRVCKTTRQNEEYTITDLSSDLNVFFGEIALMDNDVRSASIKVLEDCEVLAMGREKFVKLGDKEPGICLPITRVIAGILCNRLRSMNEDVILLFDALVNEVQEDD